MGIGTLDIVQVALFIYSKIEDVGKRHSFIEQRS